METLVDLILILNVGIGTVSAKEGAEYTARLGAHLSKVLKAKERGIEVIIMPCVGLSGVKVEIIPLKALLEGKYVSKEEIKLPEMDFVLNKLREIQSSCESTLSITPSGC